MHRPPSLISGHALFAIILTGEFSKQKSRSSIFDATVRGIFFLPSLDTLAVVQDKM